MRPETLHLKGFGPYRSMDDPIDFADADLFALTGPTGSGKSSLIDAMCFALYGRIPRLAANAVEPVISLGANEARLDFGFSVGGVGYRATRVVRRTKHGANTSEARLTRGEEVLASRADEVTAEVGRILGLGFDEFTKCVVLPQGEFAAFLHDKPAGRQVLLKTLLDLDRFDHIRQLADERRAKAEAEIAVLERSLAAADEVGEAAEAEIGRRLERLDRLRVEVDLLLDELAEIGRLRRDREETIGRLESHHRLLTGIEIPAEVTSLGETGRELDRELERLEKTLGETETRIEEGEAELEGLSPLAEIERQLGAHVRLAELSAAIGESETAIEQTATRLTKARAELEVAAARLQQALDHKGDMENLHRAHAIRSTLVEGDLCPVCLRAIDHLPETEPPEDLSAIEEKVEKTTGEHRRAERSLREIEQESLRQRDRLDRLNEEKTEVARMAVRPTEELEASKKLHQTTETRLRSDREQVRLLRRELNLARENRRRLDEEVGRLRAELGRTRDRLAELKPPVLDDRDLEVAWTALKDWAGQRLVETTRSLEEVTDEGKKVEDRLQPSTDRLAEIAGELGLEPEGLREGIIRRRAAGESELERLLATRLKLEEDRVRVEACRREVGVAAGVALALRANGFEAWMLEEALEGLVEGANQSLEALASGWYSLALEGSKVGREFAVIDHRNADERRSVKTLSGGETFLVSLALALALAERIATLSPAGTARLESIFLDEGFGTLDADTLDTVASVLHELSAGERMVGIVTHVPELAEQMPVRFVVSNGGGVASVRRVET